MAEFPIMPLCTDSYLADTKHLNSEEHGAYLMLLIISWRSRDCSIPDDDKRIAIMLGMTVKRWTQKIRPVISPFWDIGDGRWVQKKQRKVRVSVANNVQQKREAGAKGGKAKALKDNVTDLAAAKTPLDSRYDRRHSNQNQIDSESHTSAELDSPKTENDRTPLSPPRGAKTKRSRSKPIVQWPDGFHLTDEMIKYATSKTPGVDAVEDFERFRLHHQSKGSKFANWTMAWQKWCRSPYDKPMMHNGNGANGHGANGHGKASEIADIIRRKREKLSRSEGGGRPSPEAGACGPADGRRGGEAAAEALDPDQKVEGAGGEQGRDHRALGGQVELEEVPFADETGAPIPGEDRGILAGAGQVRTGL